MSSLFDTTCDFDNDVFRNIVSLRESVDLFSDLTDGDATLSAVAVSAEMRVKSDILPGLIQRGCHYSTAIGYPFDTEPYLTTRYGNGLFAVWYGSLDLDTTLHETAFHMVKEELRVEGNRGEIIRERAVYLVRCKAILLDLRGKVGEFPGLVADDYSFTHQIGERLHGEGHPGLLAPSARCNGANIVAFNPSILSDPRVNCYLAYRCYPGEQRVVVERTPGDVIAEIKTGL